MIHLDPRFAPAVEAAVTAVESRTDAEIVVVAAVRSGTYADVVVRASALVGLLVGAVLLAIPWYVGEPLFLVLVLGSYGLSTRICSLPGPLRRLTSPARRAAQVRDAAAAEFVRDAVHGTPHRSGVLVYVSAVEQRAELLVDLGVAGMVPQAELAAAAERLDATSVDGFVAGLTALGEVLSRRVPHLATSDAFDLPNAPRIRP